MSLVTLPPHAPIELHSKLTEFSTADSACVTTSAAPGVIPSLLLMATADTALSSRLSEPPTSPDHVSTPTHVVRESVRPLLRPLLPGQSVVGELGAVAVYMNPAGSY